MKNFIKKLKKLISLLNSKIYRNGLLHGVAASTEHESILKNYSFETIVDVGANKGQFALLARKCYPNANIFSFEPLSKPHKRLKKLFANDNKIKIFNFAIGPENRSQIIHVSKSDDSSSLLEITELQNKIFPGTDELNKEEIKVTVLNDLIFESEIKNPALLKLDVQGFEYEALQGCYELINLFDAIYCECSFLELYKDQKLADQIIAYLNKIGFKLDGFYNSTYDINGYSIQSDLFFKKKN